MQLRAWLLIGMITLFGAAIATINGVVDPKNEFYSGDALTAALKANCLLADDLVRPRSYPEFKRDLFERRETTRVIFGSNVGGPARVNMSFPGFGPTALLDAMQFLARVTPEGKRLAIRIATDPAWFNARVHLLAIRSTLLEKAGYLLSPWTLKSSLDLMRASRTLAFTGWRQDRLGPACVVDRGSPRPAWRADGTFTGSSAESSTWGGFAWSRLTPLDAALAIAQQHRWRVAGHSASDGPVPYARELSALFAKHGYRWRAS
jgi:hypothetical protein